MRKILLAVLACALSFGLQAQSLWTTIDIEKKINKKASAFAELEYRTHQHTLMSERASSSLGVEYEFNKYLKAQASYAFIYRQSKDEITKKNNLVPAYWSPRHRGNLSLTASYKWKKRIEISLRENYQYTYRYQMFVPKYNELGFRIPYEEVDEKHKHVAKTRLEIKYDIKKSPFEPYVSCEAYHDISTWYLDKIRYTVGSTYKINKQHRLEMYYRYINHSDEDEDAGSVLGIGYKFKF